MDFGVIGSSNPGGVNNLQVRILKVFGNVKKNITLGAFLTGHAGRATANFGSYVKFTGGRCNISFQQVRSFAFACSVCLGLDAVVFKNAEHTLSANAVMSRSQVDDGNLLQRRTLGLTYNNSKGYGASIFTTILPQIQAFIVQASGNVNLWTSSDNATTVDFTLNFTHHCCGHFAGYTKYCGSLSFTHQF